MQAALQGLTALFSLSVAAYFLLGIAWGFAISFMPGVGGIVAISLLLPFIYRLSISAALALLLGAHIATIFGSSITSIVLNVPGASKSVPLCWDGYPLAQKGQGVRALSASATSSAVGGIVGALVLAFAIPLLRPVLFAIGPGEIFLMAVLGLLIISVFSAGSLGKGVASAALGALISWIGLDPVTGIARFTFGSLTLQEGIPFPVAAIGVFAIAQAIKLLVASRGGHLPVQRTAPPLVVTHGRDADARACRPGSARKQVLEGISDVFHHKRLEVHMALFGVFCGVVPGLGAPVAAVGAYGQAAEMSKEGEEPFGTGRIEGVIAPQATDGASEGGGMLPMLALGIPAHEQQAILLSAFVILGIAPGQQLVNHHLSLVFTIVWIIIIGNVVVSAMGVIFSPLLAKLTTVPTVVLAPVIISAGLVGAVAINGVPANAAMAIGFGIFGYFLARYNYSRASFVIGFVLGPILESNLHIAVSLHGGFFFVETPLAGVLSAGIVAMLGWTVRRNRRKAGKTVGSSSTSAPQRMV